MYGLVFRGLERLIQSRSGEAAWKAVRHEAGLDADGMFVRMDEYPDAVFGQLLEAAGRHLDQTPDSLLRDFGRHWILYTVQEGYGALLDSAGDSFTSVLSNLDDMHVRVGHIHTRLQPPRFRVENPQDNGLTLHYQSVRTGLAPMVLGLLDGLAERFDLRLQVEAHHSPAPGHDVFELRW